MFRLGPVALGQKTFQRANGNWLIQLAAPARRFTWVRANPAADAGQRIGIAREAVGFFEAAFADQRDIAARIRMRRARHHAGEIGVQPISVHPLLFESLQHFVPANDRDWKGWRAGSPALLLLLRQSEILFGVA